MNAILTEQELESITQKIFEKIKATILSNESTKALEAEAKRFVDESLKWYLSENELTYQAQEALTPAIKKYLEANPNIATGIIQQHFSTDSFKQLEIDALRRRINQLEREEED